MPFAPAKTRASSWTAADYAQRFAEMRAEFGELSEKDRNSDEYKKGKESLFQERADIEFEYKCVRAASGELLPVEQARNAGAALWSPGQEQNIRSAGEIVTTDPQWKEWIGRNQGRGSSPIIEIRGAYSMAHRDAKEYEYRTLVSETLGDTANLLLPVGQPYLAGVRQRKLFIRDVLAGGSTGLAAVPYVRELNAVTNATTASTVVEGGTKPEAKIEFEADTAVAQVIAVNIPVTTQVMQDAPTVMSYINNRLSYQLALREELEILAGNGVTPDLKGIRTYAIQTQAAVSGETAQTIAAAIAKVVVVDGYPNAVAMNPVDSWAMKSKRAAGGSGTFDAGAPYSAVVDTVWGLAIVETNSIAAGHAIVGDYSLGAQYFDRMQASVRTFEQHSDFAVKNKVLIQAEERLALAMYRPDFFVDATIA